MTTICRPADPGAPVSDEPPITNDGFFPDVDVADLRARMRFRDGVTAERLREAAVAAIVTANNDLDCWAAGQKAAGHATLADVPAPAIDGASRLLFLYRRAVGCFAQADLVERYRDVDLTGAGARDADALTPSIDELRRDGRHAVRDIKAERRTFVELV